MNGRLLLDTCALIWVVEDAWLEPAAKAAILREVTEGRPIMVSPITAWERGLLAAKGRLTSPVDPRTWFRRVAARPEIELTDLTADILIESCFLPGALHRDPADRILIATARALDLTLVTRDGPILKYAGDGHVRVLAC